MPAAPLPASSCPRDRRMAPAPQAAPAGWRVRIQADRITPALNALVADIWDAGGTVIVDEVSPSGD